MQTTEIDLLLSQARKQLQSEGQVALGLAEEARELALALGGAPKQEATALCIQAQALFNMGKSQEAQTLLDLAQEYLRFHTLDEQEGEIFLLLGRIHYGAAHYVQAATSWIHCLTLPKTAILPTTQIMAHVGLGEALLVCNQDEAALAEHQQAEKLALPLDDPHLHSVTQINIAHDLIQLGRIDAALSILDDVLPQIRAEGNYAFEAEIFCLSGLAWLARHELDKAESSFTVAHKINRLQGNLWGQACCVLPMAECLLDDGQNEEAHDLLEHAQQLLTQIAAKSLMPDFFRLRARAALIEQNIEQAQRHSLEHQRVTEELQAAGKQILALCVQLAVQH